MVLAILKNFFLDILFPKQCLGCGREGFLICAQCSSGLGFVVPGCPVCSFRNGNGLVCASCRRWLDLRRLIAPFSYREKLVRELIHAYKYEGVRELASFMTDQVLDFLKRFHLKIQKSAVIVPIPLHGSRWKERGFNQAELIAKDLGQKLNLAVDPRVLRRRRATGQQIDMDSFAKRRANVRDAFRVRKPEVIFDKIVFLVDDVSTSGATLNEAAKALRQAGAKSVSAIVIAKG